VNFGPSYNHKTRKSVVLGSIFEWSTIIGRVRGS